MSIYIGSVPQATLNLQGLVYVRVKMSLQPLKAVNMIVQINHLYENEYSRTVLTETRLCWRALTYSFKDIKCSPVLNFFYHDVLLTME